MGLDSEFLQLVSLLNSKDYALRPGEPLGASLDRLEQNPDSQALVGSIRGLPELHNRYRFDPAGIGDWERRELADAVRTNAHSLITQT